MTLLLNDQSEVANDETAQFLGRIFRNSPVIEFPDNEGKIHFVYMPKEWLELGYGLFNGKSSWEKIGDNLLVLPILYRQYWE